jgi:hypothetical protein
VLTISLSVLVLVLSVLGVFGLGGSANNCERRSAEVSFRLRKVLLEDPGGRAHLRYRGKGCKRRSDLDLQGVRRRASDERGQRRREGRG